MPLSSLVQFQQFRSVECPSLWHSQQSFLYNFSRHWNWSRIDLSFCLNRQCLLFFESSIEHVSDEKRHDERTLSVTLLRCFRNKISIPAKRWHWYLKEEPILGSSFGWYSEIHLNTKLSQVAGNIIQLYKLCLNKISHGIFYDKISIVDLLKKIQLDTHQRQISHFKKSIREIFRERDQLYNFSELYRTDI